MIHLEGRIVGIKRKKSIVFLKVEGHHPFQIVIKDVVGAIDETYRIGNIISADLEPDNQNHGKYRVECESYVPKTIMLLQKRLSNKPGLELFERNVRAYAASKSRVRYYLEEHGYIEVPVPVLTDGETGSKAASFVTEFKKTGKTLFLRKTMDSFLRMYSCFDYHRIYSIGPCFRNEFVTAMNASEFEMLSVFSNYFSREEAIDLAIDLLSCIVGEPCCAQSMKQEDYSSNEKTAGFVLIEGFCDKDNSYSDVRDDGLTEEFKIKYAGITVVHGVKEITSYNRYIEVLNRQGKKEQYGELTNLEEALKRGAPPCYNIGISILRVLALYNGMKLKEFDPLSLHRLNLGRQLSSD